MALTHCLGHAPRISKGAEAPLHQDYNGRVILPAAAEPRSPGPERPQAARHP